MNMRGNTQTSGDGQLDLSHIDAGIACLVGPNSCSGSNGDGEPCFLAICRDPGGLGLPHPVVLFG
jgi:hypothetical protein